MRCVAAGTTALAAICLVGCATLVSDEATELQQSRAQAVTQILVTVPQKPPSRALGLVGAPGQSYRRRRGYGPTPAVDRSLDQLARDYDLRRVRGWSINSIGVYCEVFEIEAGRDAGETIGDLMQDPRVDVAQRMNVFETLGSSYNDPYAELQTSVSALSVEPAHRLATGRGVTVAVIDSRIDTHHPELRASVRHTRDLVDNGLLGGPEVHGTAVAGIIAAAANNTEGIVGVAPDVAIAALRACWTADRSGMGTTAHCTSFSLAQALEAALELRAQVINLSLTGPEDPLLAQLIDEAIERGVVVVAALEDARDGFAFPAMHPGVIAASPSPDLDSAVRGWLLSAPGNEILTTIPDAGYAFFTGSSLAAAHVSGTVALLLERDPDFGTEKLFALLSETTAAFGAVVSINACRALLRLAPEGNCPDETRRSAMASEAQ